MPSRNLVNRPDGTGDVLLMLFHEACHIDGQDYPAWTLRCWPDGASHRYGTQGATLPWYHSWVHMKGPLADRIADALPIARTLVDPEPVQRHLRHLAQSTAVDRDAQLSACAIHAIYRCIQRLDADETDLPVAWRELRLWMEQNAHVIETVDQVAERVHLARSQFHQRFTYYFDMSPMRFIQNVRLERARWLLRDRQRSVAAVSREVGYVDVAYFSRLIRKHFGVSPRGLRT
jgi:AraC-like DNA-binding protein